MDSALGSGVSQSDEYVNNSDGMFRFYWIDAYEDVKTQPGVLYIFGKQYNESSQSFHSCCLRVKGLQRKMFFLPAIRLDGTNYSIKEVYSELANMFEKMKIPKFKCKPVVKQYCFEPFDVPDRAEYLEVLYAATSPALPADFKGKSFSHVFGTATSLLENFVLDHQLKGPCWLDVKNAKLVQPQFSWCKVDWEIENESWLTKVVENCPPIPPLTAMAISLKISSSSKDGQNMIVAVGCLVDRKFQIDAPAPQVLYQEQFGVITNPRDAVLPFDFHDILQQGKWGPKYKSVEDDACGERSLLSRLLNFWQRVDPDIVIGHDLCAFELDILVQRLYVHRQGLWHKIGRLRRSGVMPKITGSARTAWLEKSAFVGRLICDSRVSAKELIRARAFDLSELVRVLIGNKKDAGSLLQGLALLSTPGDGGNATDLRHLYDNSLSLRKLIDFTFVSAYASLRLIHEMQVMPLALQITTICGNFLNRTLIGGRAERNEYLLLHAFTEKNYIPPDKGFKKHSHSEDHNAVTLGRRKPAYTGGLVLEPKKGFYDKFILLLDFNSLYPSIMQEYNICFTTISRQEMAAKKRDESAVSEEKDENTFLPTLPHSNVAQGVLPTEIRKLVESRRAVKALLSKNASATVTQKSQWDIRQKALKITANSMYGCLGFGFSRFHAQHLAALITAKGREILMKTKDLVEGMGFEVIYGDTDSIMVNVNSTDYDQIFKIGGKIKAEVNKLYKMLELEVDGVFKAMLLLKKKQYAALTIVGKNPDGSLITKQELKGVDIVRRDWCRLAVEVGENIVTQILNVDEESQSLGLVDNIFEQLRQTAARIQEGKIPIEKYVITKALAKNPEDYHDPKGQPHVLVALRLNSSSGGDKSGNTGGKRLKAGDTVEYIICDDASNTPATQRAYALQEVKARASSDKPLPVDLHYYLSHQLHPVISRLCSVIDGIDGANLADALGLDPTSYATADRAHREATGEASDDEGQRDNIGRHRYDACDPLQLICPHCSQPLPEIRKPFTAVDKENEIALNHWKCPACDKIVLSQEESIAKIFNQILILIRQFQRKYSSGLLQCDNGAVACGYQVRQIPCMSTTSIAQQLACPHCCQGQLRPAYSAGKLYRQLDFIRFLFDVGEPEKGDGSVAKLQETFVDLVNGFLKKSDYSVVSCDILFADLMKFAAVNV